jgi:hypothetical protein
VRDGNAQSGGAIAFLLALFLIMDIMLSEKTLFFAASTKPSFP